MTAATNRNGIDAKSTMSVTIEEALESEGFYVGLPTGNSMWPMLRSGKDHFVIVPVSKSMLIGDVALFRQNEKLILHRIINRNENEYTMRGDNCISCEHVSHKAIIGKLSGFYRGSSYFDCEHSVIYSIYCRSLVFHYLTNRTLQALKAFFRRLSG